MAVSFPKQMRVGGCDSFGFKRESGGCLPLASFGRETQRKWGRRLEGLGLGFFVFLLFVRIAFSFVYVVISIYKQNGLVPKAHWSLNFFIFCKF
jgi:hypothetical protein